MNWEMLRLAADHIEKDPSSFDMDHFGFAFGCGTVSCCGTVACLAGHIVWANDPDEFESLVNGGRSYRIEERACELLGIEIDPSDFYDLFYGGDLSFDCFNHNKNKVPAAIRWMADTHTASWEAAAEAVGFTDKGDVL